MTNLEALKARVNYPLPDNSLELALINRSLDKDDIYAATSQAFDLAYADCLATMISSPASVSEGGFSISTADLKRLADIANSIYLKYGVASLLPSEKPTVTFKQVW